VPRADSARERQFRVSRRIAVAGLLLASLLLAGYWVAWLANRSLVASDDTAGYIAFEQAFPLADAWLLATALLAALQLLRRRPTALVWASALGGAGIYLCALDVLYDLQHGIYAKGGAGLVELGINLFTLASGVAILAFAVRFREQLLADPSG
jgi:hypothetical protein